MSTGARLTRLDHNVRRLTAKAFFSPTDQLIIPYGALALLLISLFAVANNHWATRSMSVYAVNRETDPFCLGKYSCR